MTSFLFRFDCRNEENINRFLVPMLTFCNPLGLVPIGEGRIAIALKMQCDKGQSRETKGDGKNQSQWFQDSCPKKCNLDNSILFYYYRIKKNMCGRAVNPDRFEDYKQLLYDDFYFFDDKRNSFLIKDLNELPDGYINYNVAPTSAIPVISNNDPKTVQLMNWRYDMKIKGKLIPLFNSKIEQAEKNNSYFRHDLQERRCVVLFKGFYEWIKQDPTNKKTLKQPVFISLKNSPVMPLAGVYKKNEDGTEGCSIITTTPLESVSRVHNRMPFILNPDSIFDYLNPRLNGDKALILDWLSNNLIDNDNLSYYPVNQAVGSVKNKQPSLLDKCEPIFEI